jgi:hypothetical protein
VNGNTDTPDQVRDHIADVVLLAQGIDPNFFHSRAEWHSTSPATITRANHIADRLLPHLLVFRDMVEAAEAAGWDIGDNANLLNRARDACAALVGTPS